MNPKIEEVLKALEYEAFMWRGNDVSAVCLDAADLITKLQQELIDERYRHDRYADFCVAQGEELSALKADMETATRGNFCDVCAHLPPDKNEHCARCSYENSEFKWRDIQVPGAPKEDANENAQG